MWTACITIHRVLLLYLESLCPGQRILQPTQQLLTRQQISFHFNPLHSVGVRGGVFQSMKAALHLTLDIEPVPKEAFQTVLTEIDQIHPKL